ncbi:MAG: carboxypeptidase-like regulatory domain-containing protein [Crocinitomicaceae bacterium]|nr:carboxypeptidase-like regulatory domain-containing protein [Crocinitomicaceae bacterium]
MKRVFLILFFFNIIHVLWSQENHDHELENEIRGKIVATENGKTEPIPGAKIKWKSDTHMAVSGLDGSFEIHVGKLPDTLFIKAVGYQLLAFEVKEVRTDLVLICNQDKCWEE